MFCPPKYTLVIGDILIKKSFFSNKSVNFLRGVVVPSIGCKSNKQPWATARRGRVEWKQGGKGGKSKHPRAKPLKGMQFSQIPLFKPRQYHFQTFQYQKIRQILNSYITVDSRYKNHGYKNQPLIRIILTKTDSKCSHTKQSDFGFKNQELRI